MSKKIPKNFNEEHLTQSIKKYSAGLKELTYTPKIPYRDYNRELPEMERYIPNDDIKTSKQEEVIKLTRAEYNTMIDLVKHTAQLQKEIKELYLALLLQSNNLPRA